MEELDMPYLTVGKLAKASNVGIETVRFYEQKGLMPKPDRSSSGYRIYNEDSIARLNFIQKSKNLGFRLEEIMDILAISKDPNADCGDTCQKLDKKIIDIEQRIEGLKRMKKGLAELREDCPGEGYSLDECVMLKYFYRDNSSD